MDAAASTTTTTPPRIKFPPQILPPPPGIPTFHNNVMPMAAGAVSIHAICPRNNPSARIDLRIILHAVPQKDTQDEIRSDCNSLLTQNLAPISERGREDIGRREYKASERIGRSAPSGQAHCDRRRKLIVGNATFIQSTQTHGCRTGLPGCERFPSS